MKPIRTIPSGERTWFVRREGGQLVWALLWPHADGSATIRTESASRTFAPPAGSANALSALEADGYMLLEDARALGGMPKGEPPKW